MARLIDADTLIEEIKKVPNFGKEWDKALCVAIVNEQPTVDAVQVVRCKDCKHRIYSYMTGGTYYCEFDCYYSNETARDANNPDYFCASGERKDGDSYAND